MVNFKHITSVLSNSCETKPATFEQNLSDIQTK